MYHVQQMLLICSSKNVPSLKPPKNPQTNTYHHSNFSWNQFQNFKFSEKKVKRKQGKTKRKKKRNIWNEKKSNHH